MSDLFLGELSTDVTPPEVTYPWPDPGMTGVAKDEYISFRLTDLETNVDPDSVVITVNGVVAWSGRLEQNGFTVYEYDGSGDGIWDYDIYAPADFASYAVIEVTVDAQDLAVLPNVMDQYVWSFQIDDYEDPYVEDPGYAPVGPGIAQSALITFLLKDDGAGVDLTQTKVTVGGVVAYDGGAGGFQGEFVGGASAVDATGAPNVYGFTIDKTPDYAEYTTYQVKVESRDLR